MHTSWRFIPSIKALAIVFGALAVLGISFSGAWAQDEAGDSPGAVKKYIFMSSAGAWGAAQSATVARLGGTLDRSHAGAGIGIVSSADPQFLKAAMRSGSFSRGAEDIMVQWQSPVNEQELTEDAVNPADDNFINLQWSITAINAAGAWSAGYDGAGVRVAVIDGGMCDLHPDVAPNLDVARSTSFVPGFTYNQDTGGAAGFRHACHVAGIIAAVDNTIGTIGVAPKATIISVKALHGGSGSFAAVISSILYAADPISEGGGGADIINMSLGATFAKGGGNTGNGALIGALSAAVGYATDRNVLVVCSAGNNALDLDHSGSITSIPAQSGSAIAVSATAPVGFAVGWPNGATNFSDAATYSNYGNSVTWVAAPGGDSALPGNALCSIPRVVGAPVTTACWVFDLVISPGSQSGSYFFAAGTSMAAPHVAGVAALIKQANPGITVGDLKAQIAQSAGPGGTGPSNFYGHGFLDAAAAVAAHTPGLAAAKPAQIEAAKGRVDLVITRNGSSVPEIYFSLPKAGQAKVELFDVAGRKVAELFNGQANAGVTRATWSAGSLHQGAYFARLTAGGVQTARQLMLLGE